MSAPADEPEVQPSALVTVKVYEPAGKSEIVALVPLPVVVTPPGLRVMVQLSDDGNPLNATLPVASSQVGCVMVPTTGAVGVGG